MRGDEQTFERFEECLGYFLCALDASYSFDETSYVVLWNIPEPRQLMKATDADGNARERWNSFYIYGR